MLLTVEKVIFLKSVDIFSEIPEEALVEVASAAVDLHVSPQQDIFKKGDLGTSMYIVSSGRVRLHGGIKSEVILAERKVFGLLEALDPEPRLVFATALEQTHLLRLDRDILYDLMSENTEIASGVIHVLCGRLRQKQ